MIMKKIFNKFKPDLCELSAYCTKKKTLSNNAPTIETSYTNSYFWFACIVFFSLTFYLFWCQSQYENMNGLFPSDLPVHLYYGAKGESYSLSSVVFYIATKLFKGQTATVISVAFLAFCNIFSVVIIRNLMLKTINDKSKSYLIDAISISLFLLSMLFWPSEQYAYLVRSTPNVWHNSTSLVCRLFSILTVIKFFEVFNFYDKFKNKEITCKKLVFEYLLLALFATLCMFAKASFLSAFLPACVIVLLGKLITSKGKSFMPSLFVGLSFIPSMFVLYIQNSILFPENGESSVIFAPFLVILSRLDIHIYFINMIIGIAFPLFVFTFTFRRINFQEAVLYLSYAISQLIYILFAESGSRLNHGNFGWGIILTSFFIFYIAIVRLLKPDTPKIIKRIGFMLFSLHVVCGIIYFSKLLLGLTYL